MRNNSSLVTCNYNVVTANVFLFPAFANVFLFPAFATLFTLFTLSMYFPLAITD